MDVPRRGVETVMSQQDLNGPQVGTGFEQVGRETVAQGTNGDVLGQAGGLARPEADFPYASGGNGSAGDGAGEEDLAGPSSFPISAEDLQQPRGEHDVAVLLPLALA